MLFLVKFNVHIFSIYLWLNTYSLWILPLLVLMEDTLNLLCHCLMTLKRFDIDIQGGIQTIRRNTLQHKLRIIGSSLPYNALMMHIKEM